MNAWLRPAGRDGLTLTLHIQPGARTTAFAGVHGDALKIRLAAPPVDGKANTALIAFLAEAFGLPRSAVVLKSGHSARRKVVALSGISPSAVASRCNIDESLC
jgi:uncharacterized protein